MVTMTTSQVVERIRWMIQVKHLVHSKCSVVFFRESRAEWLLSVFQDWETFLISHGHKQISLCPISATLSPTFLHIFGPGNLGFSQVVSWDPPKEENWKRVIRELYIFYFNVLVLIFLQSLGLFTNNQQLGSALTLKGFVKNLLQHEKYQWTLYLFSYAQSWISLRLLQVMENIEQRGVWAQSGALFSLEEGNIGRYSQAESTEDGPKGRIKRYPISLFA